MSAQPVDPVGGDHLDPLRILGELPGDEQGFFLAQYRETVEVARDPAGWKQLDRLLRRWRYHGEAVKDPGYAEALEAAGGPISSGMLLEDAVRLYRPAL